MTTLHLHADPYYNLPPVTTEAPAGLTIAQMLDYVADGVERTNALHVLVKRNGHSHVVPAQLWHKVRPKPGTEISVLRTVEVGDSDALRSIAMIAVMAFSAWVTGGGAASLFSTGSFWGATAGSYALGAMTSMVGALHIRAATPQ